MWRALDVDKLIPIILERVEKIRLLSVIKKKGGKKVGWHACIPIKTIPGPHSYVATLLISAIFFKKIAEAMKAVSYIMEVDTMLQISGVTPEKVFVLNLSSFLPDTFF